MLLDNLKFNMLIFKDTKFIKSPFDSEAELETVIMQNYEYLFGPNSFYLPKAIDAETLEENQRDINSNWLRCAFMICYMIAPPMQGYCCLE